MTLTRGTPVLAKGQAELIYWSCNPDRYYLFDSYSDQGEFAEWQGSQLQPLELTAEVLRTNFSRFYSFGRYFSVRSGSDPEIFAELNGEPLAAWKFLSSEAEAKPVYSPIIHYHPPEAKAYWDGAQAELSTSGKVDCHILLVDDIQCGLKAIYSAMKAKFPGAELVCKDVVKLSKQDLASGPEDAIRFGCNPSFNVYGIPAVQIEDARAMPLRFSGTHIHQSTRMAEIQNTPPAWWPDGVVVMLDKIVGVTLTALGRGLENPERRKFYGRPGEYRLPQREERLSLEYRTPGSFLMRSPTLMNFAFDLTRKAFQFAMIADGRLLDIPDVVSLIMNCDADAALKLMAGHSAIFNQFLRPVDLRAIKLGASGLGFSSVESEWGLSSAKPWRAYNNNLTCGWSSVLAARRI